MHVLLAVIGPTEVLWGERLGGGIAVPLAQGLSLVPLVDVRDELATAFGQYSEDAVRAGFGQPPPSLTPRLTELSQAGPVAFVETEYFGGAGDQACVVWQGGGRVLGPVRGSGSINRALRLLGVTAFPGKDEFDSVGLGSYRQTGHWLEAGTAAEPQRAPDRGGRKSLNT
jgi:hypothetical protein